MECADCSGGNVLEQSPETAGFCLKFAQGLQTARLKHGKQLQQCVGGGCGVAQGSVANGRRQLDAQAGGQCIQTVLFCVADTRNDLSGLEIF